MDENVDNEEVTDLMDPSEPENENIDDVEKQEDQPDEDKQVEDILKEDEPQEENKQDDNPLEEIQQDYKPTEENIEEIHSNKDDEKISANLENQDIAPNEEGAINERLEVDVQEEIKQPEDIEKDKLDLLEDKILYVDENKESTHKNSKTSDENLKAYTATEDGEPIKTRHSSLAHAKVSIDDKLRISEYDRSSIQHNLALTRGGSSYEKESCARSCDDSFYVQESPEGQDILNELYSEKHGRLRVDDESYVSFSDKEIAVDSVNSKDTIFHRFEIIDKIRIANEERKTMITENQFLQSKLIEYFRMVKVKQTAGTKQSSEKESLMDFNTQYLRYAEILYGLMKELEGYKLKFDEKIEKLKSASEFKNKQVDDANNELSKYEESVGLSSLHSRTGNRLETSVISDYLQYELKKEMIIKDVRLSNLKIEHKNMNLDRALRSKENFEGGLRLIDFEQLKIENQTFNEKVEDREEGINKLNRKINKCNHLLSHIKEKIDVTDKDKKTSRIKSKILDKEFKKVQKVNNKVKKLRDSIKANNRNLQVSCGLLGKKEYLRCYEDASDETDILRSKIANMEAHKSSIVNKTSQLKKNIMDTHMTTHLDKR